METKTIRKDVYEIVTSIIIEKLEQGIIPWKQTWISNTPPMNLITKKPYRGLNVLLLSSLDYPTNYFLTFKQLIGIGGRVKKGEKSHLVVFWKWDQSPATDDKAEDGKEAVQHQSGPLLRYYQVFNVDQCENIPPSSLTDASPINDNDPIANCEEITGNMPQRPEIRFKHNVAFYHPYGDYVNMPAIDRFDNSECYYHTLFHELVHSTGHESRVCRKWFTSMDEWGADVYSFEELIAEIGSCYLDALAGISPSTIDNNVAYIQGWLARLKNDKRFIIDAACKAQKAVDFILGSNYEPVLVPLEDRELVLAQQLHFKED